MARWIEVRYKCRCMSAEATVHVERRVAEDILDFMTRVQVALGDDHRKRSALCSSPTVEYAKVPADGDIGKATGEPS